jgi:hypothetical protein
VSGTYVAWSLRYRARSRVGAGPNDAGTPPGKLFRPPRLCTGSFPGVTGRLRKGGQRCFSRALSAAALKPAPQTQIFAGAGYGGGIEPRTIPGGRKRSA